MPRQHVAHAAYVEHMRVLERQLTCTYQAGRELKEHRSRNSEPQQHVQLQLRAVHCKAVQCARRELTAMLHQGLHVSVQQSRPGAPGALRSLYLSARPVEVYPVIRQALRRYHWLCWPQLTPLLSDSQTQQCTPGPKES